jgi:hypothetical protein
MKRKGYKVVEEQCFEFAASLRELERKTFMMPKVFEFTYAKEADFDIEIFNNKLQEILQDFPDITLVVQIAREYKINLLIK